MLTLEKIQLITSLLILGGIIFTIYKFFRDPDISAAKSIELINQRCKLTHKNLNETILDIKENHLEHIRADLKHIEADIQEMKQDITRILTILDEKNK